MQWHIYVNLTKRLAKTLKKCRPPSFIYQQINWLCFYHSMILFYSSEACPGLCGSDFGNLLRHSFNQEISKKKQWWVLTTSVLDIQSIWFEFKIKYSEPTNTKAKVSKNANLFYQFYYILLILSLLKCPKSCNLAETDTNYLIWLNIFAVCKSSQIIKKQPILF